MSAKHPLLFAALLLSGCASTRACESGLAASPQFQADSCTFRNVANPDAKPTQDGWRIWSRFFFGKKTYLRDPEQLASEDSTLN
jgi:hypothetical protein